VTGLVRSGTNQSQSKGLEQSHGFLVLVPHLDHQIDSLLHDSFGIQGQSLLETPLLGGLSSRGGNSLHRRGGKIQGVVHPVQHHLLPTLDGPIPERIQACQVEEVSRLKARVGV
jgi:hypothetical protein